MKHVVSILVRVLSCLCMAASLFMLLLSASLISTAVALSLHVSSLALTVSQLIPAPLSFWGVLASPFGGVFRTDFIIVAIVLFVAAKLLHLLRKAL